MSKNLTFEQWLRINAGTPESRNSQADEKINEMLEADED